MPDYKELYSQMRAVAGEAIALADAYAGGESETVVALMRRLERIEEHAAKAEGRTDE